MTALGKRSDFPRLPQDEYNTPREAVLPLLECLKPRTQFVEPCAGAGHLTGHLKRAGHILAGAYDLPDDARTKRYDVRGRRLLHHQPAVELARRCTSSSST